MTFPMSRERATTAPTGHKRQIQKKPMKKNKYRKKDTKMHLTNQPAAFRQAIQRLIHLSGYCLVNDSIVR